jgi:hypothetical protein
MVHAANVADGAVRAATCDNARGRVYNRPTISTSPYASFYVGRRRTGRRVRLLSIPKPMAQTAFAALVFVLKVATAGH